MKRHAVVVGGGVIGVASAYYLAKAGWQVTVLDRARSGAACSRGNCGIIGMSHFMPLNAPGAIAKTLKGMLRPDSPFSIRPRFDPRLWMWLSKFALRCNKKDMMQSARARGSLLAASHQLFNNLFEAEPIECELVRNGTLFAFRTKKGFESYAESNNIISREFGASADRYDSKDLVDFEPSMRDDLAGGWHYPIDYHLRPDRLVDSWRSVNAGLGVEVRESTLVTGFSADPSNSRRAATIMTDRGEIQADAIVVAMGAMTPIMNEHLGCAVPVQPGKGYSITQSRPANCPKLPVFFMENKVVVTPFETGYRLGSTMEFAGYDTRFRPKRLALLEDGAKRFMKEPSGERSEEVWFGWRSMTYDGLPFIDRSPKFDNVVVATGHNMIGLTLAPITGKLASELVAAQSTMIDVHPLRLGR